MCPALILHFIMMLDSSGVVELASVYSLTWIVELVFIQYIILLLGVSLA